MMKTVTVDGEQHDVEVCDKCATAPKDALIPLYRNVETRVYGPYSNPTDVTPTFEARVLEKVTPAGQYVQALTFRLESDRILVEELRDEDPEVELCEDCYDEVLSWGEE